MTDFGDLIANDFALVCDQLETITISLDRNIPETVTVTTANRSVLRKSNNVFSNVQFEEGDIQFAFPANAFSPQFNTGQDAQIKQRDTITDSVGIVYIVQSSQLSVLQTVWNVVARVK